MDIRGRSVCQPIN
ncbi:hypothetical protein ACHAXR_011266 [Thalassiosira sp. AJA248-18]